MEGLWCTACTRYVRLWEHDAPTDPTAACAPESWGFCWRPAEDDAVEVRILAVDTEAVVVLGGMDD